MPHFLVRLDPPAIYITAAGLGSDVYPSIKMARAALDDGVRALITTELRAAVALANRTRERQAERAKDLRAARDKALRVREADLKTEPAKCEACGGSGAVSTTEVDHEGNHIECACPLCNAAKPALTETLTAIRGELDAAGVGITLDDVLLTEFPLRDSPRAPCDHPAGKQAAVRGWDGHGPGVYCQQCGERIGNETADTVAEIGRQVRDGVTGGRAA